MDRHYPCIGVVADDLPGAIIAGAALRKSGLRVVVVSEQERDWPSQADAVVVSAGSREVAAGVRSSPLRSEELISSYVRRLRSELRCRRVALRIDAALRRDFTADVTAALQAARLSDPVTLAVMAMPRAGRITVNGRQTAFIADGEERERLVSRHVFGDLGAHVVCEATISRGAGAITDEIEAGLARTRRFVLDSSREPHLLAIANAAATLELRYDLLTVSSGSWLSYFPGEATGSAFVLVAIGLPTPPSDKQIKALVDESNCRLLTVDQAMHLAMGSSVELLTEVANADVIAIFVPGDEGSTSYTDPARIDRRHVAGFRAVRLAGLRRPDPDPRTEAERKPAPALWQRAMAASGRCPLVYQAETTEEVDVAASLGYVPYQVGQPHRPAFLPALRLYACRDGHSGACPARSSAPGGVRDVPRRLARPPPMAMPASAGRPAAPPATPPRSSSWTRPSSTAVASALCSSRASRRPAETYTPDRRSRPGRTPRGPRCSRSKAAWRAGRSRAPRR